MTDFVKKKKNLTELENKVPDVSSLETKTALTSVENKIPSVSNLIWKTDENTKFTEIENKLNNHNHYKYIETPEFNKLAADVFNVRLAQGNLKTKTDFDAKSLRLNRKFTQNKTEHLLVENELNNFWFELLYWQESFWRRWYTKLFKSGILITIIRYFKVITDTDFISSWKSKGSSAESIKPPAAYDDSLTRL